MLDDDEVQRGKRRIAIIITVKSRHRRTVCKTRLKNNNKQRLCIKSTASGNLCFLYLILFTWFHFAGKQTASFRDEPIYVRIGPLP